MKDNNETEVKTALVLKGVTFDPAIHKVKTDGEPMIRRGAFILDKSQPIANPTELKAFDVREYIDSLDSVTVVAQDDCSITIKSRGIDWSIGTKQSEEAIKKVLRAKGI